MPPLRNSLKYTPTMVLGLLVIVWTATYFFQFGAAIFFRGHTYKISCERGNVSLMFFNEREPGWHFRQAARSRANAMGYLSGTFRQTIRDGGPPPHTIITGATIPFPLLVTAILPLAIGPLISFRFRLWHYLAFTALVAVELAYYLRWQE